MANADGHRDRNDHGQFDDRIPARAALDLFEERSDQARPLTASDVMEGLDCSRRTAHNKLGELVDQGLLETRKVGARSRVWWIPMPRPDPLEDGAERAGTEPAVDPGTARTRAVEERIDEIDLPGSGSTLTARREALRAAYDYLVENPSARKSDFLADVFPDHPAEYDTAEGWWNALQPALKELPGVDPPEERGHIWHFLGG